MFDFNLKTQIYRPLKQVFNFVATSENDFQWQYGTLSSSQISNGTIGIGTRFRTTGHFMGRRIESVYEVTDFETNEKYGYKSVAGPIDTSTIYTFEIVKGSTEVQISIRLDPRNFCRAETVAVQKKIKKQYGENLALLKAVLETSGIAKT